MEKRTKRKNFLSSFLAILVMAVMLIGSMAQAVFADDYVAGKTGNINLTIQETGEDGTVKPIPNVNLTLYKVGSVTFDRNVHFVVDSALQFTGIDFENLKTADEWYKTADTLSAAVKKAGLSGSEMQSDANGSAWTLAKGIFDALGAKTYVIHAEPDGTNINNNCGSTHIESLQELVLREHLDAGFAFDGDADRCLCVDEKGNVITGDHILYIYGCYMKERGKLVDNKVVTTVMSNFGLYKAFDAVGIDYEKTKVGDKYVYECMSKNGYRLGGEQSGHIIFSKYATTGDGIITALKMMEVMLAKKKPLSQLAEPLAIYPQVLKNVRVTDKTQAQNDADVRAMVERAAKELGTDGRILVRESGTEPLVRVMVEAGNVETCEKYVDAVIDVIRSKGYVIE